jgi:hypothetical protein
MASINTLLLHVFRTLSRQGRSFSNGDLAFLDEGPDYEVSIYDALIQAGGMQGFDADWGELVLRIPLDNQCGCDACVCGAAPKCAVLFRRTMGYVQLKLRPAASTSLAGMFEFAWRAMGMANEAVAGCHNRSSAPRLYGFHLHDRDTYERVFAKTPELIAGAFEEHSRYNARARTGDEFYVPTALVKGSVGCEVV